MARDDLFRAYLSSAKTGLESFGDLPPITLAAIAVAQKDRRSNELLLMPTAISSINCLRVVSKWFLAKATQRSVHVCKVLEISGIFSWTQPENFIERKARFKKINFVRFRDRF